MGCWWECNERSSGSQLRSQFSPSRLLAHPRKTRWVPSALGGGNAFHHWLEPVFAGHIGGHEMGVGLVDIPAGVTVTAEAAAENSSIEIVLMVLSVLVAAAGILLARLFYARRPELPALVSARLGGVYTLVANKYYIDELYERTIVRPGYALSDKLMFRVIDAGIIEGIVNGVGITARLFGAVTRLAQSGVVRGSISVRAVLHIWSAKRALRTMRC